MKREGKYYVYITTNQHKTVLYIGVTNDLARRVEEHRNNALFSGTHFTGKYQSYWLIYYEEHNDINKAILREKELKGWRRSKKMDLIMSVNPELAFLNYDIY